MTSMLSEIGLRVRTGLSMLEWRSLAGRVGRCPFCGPTVFVRLNRDPLGARCLRCAAWPVSMAMARAVEERVPDLARARVYEASARGPFVDHLRRCAAEVVRSEYWDDVPRGDLRDGVSCQDLERLTFPDCRFDVCTSTEVFEHVADDRAAFRELRRVLAPGGWLLFTVPLFDRVETVERAHRRPDGRIDHRLPADYHDDRIRGAGRVLVFREYGADIVDRLAEAGFVETAVREIDDATGYGHRPRVVVARRPQ